MDELFGGPSGQSCSNGRSSAEVPAPQSASSLLSSSRPTPSSNVNDVLDSLFTAPVPAKAPQSRESQGQTIYVDRAMSSRQEVDLIDFSRPAEIKTYNNAERFLDAFERKKRNGAFGGRHDENQSLQSLTRNKDDNKVRAALLPLMNYYDVLGVPQTASVEEIKHSYRRRALELHPDRVGSAQTGEEAELFKVITKANEVLTDSERRREYDSELLQSAEVQSPRDAANAWWNHLRPRYGSGPLPH